MINYYQIDLAAGLIVAVLPHERELFILEFLKMWDNNDFEHDTVDYGGMTVDIIMGEEHMYQRITIKG